MDLRHGFCSTWRRCSHAPPSARTCTPATLVPLAPRRLTPRQRGVKQGLPANCAVALDSILRPPVGSESVVVDGVPGQGSCSPDAACPAVLQTRLSKAHSSATSAALVVQDTPDEKLVATASLDKGMAIWRFYSTQGECENADGSCEESIEVTRLKVPGAPVFSLAKIPEVLPDGTIVRKRPKPAGIYLGTSSKEVLTWMLGSKDVTDKVVLDGHTGWVRSLAVTGKWLFSCGCNFLRIWDTTFRTPKECDAVRLFTGDILSIVASEGRVFTTGADGSLRSWTITRTGDLREGPSRERAHDGRVSACVIAGGRVFTVSYDGSIKAWSVETLELVAEVKGAHNGDKVFCVAVGSNGVVFTGGDDKLLRAWDQDLNSIGSPLAGHSSSVRVLSAGRRALLVSGDADGDVCIWETYPVEAQPARASGRSMEPPEVGTADMLQNGASAATTTSLADLGIPAPPSSVEVVITEAAMQHLESMLASGVQPEQQQYEVQMAHQTHGLAMPAMATELGAVSVGTEVQLPQEQQVMLAAAAEGIIPQWTQQQEQHYLGSVQQPEQASPVVPEYDCPSEQRLPEVGQARSHAIYVDDLHDCSCSNAEQHMVDCLMSGSYVEASSVCVEGDVLLQVAALGEPAAHGNGTGGFTVMAATVSEDAGGDPAGAAAAGSNWPTGAGGSPVRVIEVVSVASAVAVACLAKD